MQRLHRPLAFCLLIAAIAGCDTVPHSLIDGNPGHAADRTLFPVRIVSVDGQILTKPGQLDPGSGTHHQSAAFQDAPGLVSRRDWQQEPEAFQATPGTHDVVLQFGGFQKSFVLAAKPCTAYHLGARFRVRPSDWILDATNTEPVGNCKPEEEIRKAMAPSEKPPAPAPSPGT